MYAPASNQYLAVVALVLVAFAFSLAGSPNHCTETAVKSSFLVFAPPVIR